MFGHVLELVIGVTCIYVVFINNKVIKEEEIEKLRLAASGRQREVTFIPGSS